LLPSEFGKKLALIFVSSSSSFITSSILGSFIPDSITVSSIVPLAVALSLQVASEAASFLGVTLYYLSDYRKWLQQLRQY
jgi:hypothetical protein